MNKHTLNLLLLVVKLNCRICGIAPPLSYGMMSSCTESLQLFARNNIESISHQLPLFIKPVHSLFSTYLRKCLLCVFISSTQGAGRCKIMPHASSPQIAST
ncbi:hypothetical protein F4801DRAFT_548945 [Xylaria longipes]|nr:hypothetical protein F4801DRAFT_548945 [Xylaria longipes]